MTTMMSATNSAMLAYQPSLQQTPTYPQAHTRMLKSRVRTPCCCRQDKFRADSIEKVHGGR